MPKHTLFACPVQRFIEYVTGVKCSEVFIVCAYNGLAGVTFNAWFSSRAHYAERCRLQMRQPVTGSVFQA